MNILFIGDICGRSGRDAVFDKLYDLKQKYEVDVCIANCENAAGGFGITLPIFEELERAGVDGFTTGNHVWSKKDIVKLFDDGFNIIRPANLPKDDPGDGYMIFTAKNGEKIAVINIMGRVYIDMPLDNPFHCVDRILGEIGDRAKHILVDFHAEATSEKRAMGYFLDGRVSAVFGTHTHVQTADECILKGGTAYITDAGMTGPEESVLGVKKELAIAKFTSSQPVRFEAAEGKGMLCGVFVKTDEKGKAVKIERIRV